MRALFYGILLSLVSGLVFAQGAQVPFEGLGSDGPTTVEVTADSLGIDQATGKAVFSGNVVIGIEGMRLSADKVEIVYSSESTGGGGPVSRLIASGNVVFSNGAEAAEANLAEVDIDAGEVVMTGDVILTQGNNALSGQKLRINLNTGTALIEGGVQTIFQTGDGQ